MTVAFAPFALDKVVQEQLFGLVVRLGKKRRCGTVFVWLQDWSFLHNNPYVGSSVLCSSAIRCVFLFQKSLKNLDPSYKMDLDFLRLFWKKKIIIIINEKQQQKKTLSYNQINIVKWAEPV